MNKIKAGKKSEKKKSSYKWVNHCYEGLDGILKSGDISLLTKVPIVKAMVFPVIMYGCESWTLKKAECQRIDAFKLCAVEDS